MAALRLIFRASEAKFPRLPVAGEPNEEVPFFFSTMTFASLRLGWPTNRLENNFVLDSAQNVPKPRNRDLRMRPYRGQTSAFQPGTPRRPGR
jgi:hypothetical protein